MTTNYPKLGSLNDILPAVPTSVTTSTVTTDEDGLLKTISTLVSSPSVTVYDVGSKFTETTKRKTKLFKT